MRQVKGSYMVCQGTAFSFQFKGIPSQDARDMSYFYMVFVGLLHCMTHTTASLAKPAQDQEPDSLLWSGSFMTLFSGYHLLYAAFGATASTKVQWITTNHFSCCSQLSFLLFESFYCFPIFSILALNPQSLLAKSHLIQILSLVHLCYYLLYPFYVMYPSHLNFIIITT